MKNIIKFSPLFAALVICSTNVVGNTNDSSSAVPMDIAAINTEVDHDAITPAFPAFEQAKEGTLCQPYLKDMKKAESPSDSVLKKIVSIVCDE